MRATAVILCAVGLVLVLKLGADHDLRPALPNMLLPDLAPRGDVIEGKARVTDGDTLRINGTPVRLAGVDAPERDQTCVTSSHQIWQCGAEATAALNSLISGRTVSCVSATRDRYGRVVAPCEVGGQDIGGWMVQTGWAMAYRRYSSAYVRREEQARNQRLGIWAGSVEPPWDWRVRH